MLSLLISWQGQFIVMLSEAIIFAVTVDILAGQFIVMLSEAIQFAVTVDILARLACVNADSKYVVFVEKSER